MTRDELLCEIDFLSRRVAWLKTQARDSDGELMCSDHRDEAGTLLRRVEELEVLARGLLR